jgi:glycosyltransferase involved in cell wall biosynthesis
MIDYAVLIPAYNAGKTIRELILRVQHLAVLPVEIVVINDGSNDDTLEVLSEHEVTVLKHENNYGKGRALKTGFNYFLNKGYSGAIICLDADLQHPPEIITDFISYAETHNCRFIIGNRTKRIGEMPLHRIISNRLTSMIISLIIGQKIPDSQCGFRWLHTAVLKNINLQEDGFQLESEMILKAAQQGICIGSVSIPVIYNDSGSHIGNVRDTVKFIRLVLKFVFSRKK